MSHGLLNGFFTRNGRALRQLCRVGFALSVIALIVLSLLPDDDMPDIDVSDKIGHFVAYAETVLLGTLGYSTRTGAIAILAGMAVLGGAIELGQLYIPGRSADIADFAVNCLGMAVGYAAARIVAMMSRA